jgi:hypothetical protein
MFVELESDFWRWYIPSTTYARQESKKEDNTNSTIKTSGLDKQYQGGKNYDLRDAIKQIEGIKLMQQEQQKKYFLTIPSLLVEVVFIKRP